MYYYHLDRSTRAVVLYHILVQGRVLVCCTRAAVNVQDLCWCQAWPAANQHQTDHAKNHSLSSTQAMFGDLNDIVCPSAAMLLTAANVAQLGWRVIQHPSFQIQEHFTGKIMYNCTGLYWQQCKVMTVTGRGHWYTYLMHIPMCALDPGRRQCEWMNKWSNEWMSERRNVWQVCWDISASNGSSSYPGDDLKWRDRPLSIKVLSRKVVEEPVARQPLHRPGLQQAATCCVSNQCKLI